MIFIDTGAFLARYLIHDQYHRRAAAFWKKLGLDKESCFTSNFVLDELYTLLGRRAGSDFAVQRARNIYASRALVILRPDQNDELKALNYFRKYADQNVSFTDCVSFVLMKREEIHRVFSFDKHFELTGFKLHP
ncbi:MAG: PIN domain-containing protein [Pseudomonadota bacterium]